MLENNLKELGTMLVKAGNTIERQKEEIERLRRENQRLKENISMHTFKFSFVGDFNVLIYDPIMKKSVFFEDGNSLYKKNLGEYENREIVVVGVYKDCEGVPFLKITLNS